jgi:hypothetical protein
MDINEKFQLGLLKVAAAAVPARQTLLPTPTPTLLVTEEISQVDRNPMNTQGF